MSVDMKHRQSVTIDDYNWEKYCDIKTKYMREFGKPELSFTEFINACMYFSDVGADQILELRRVNRRKA